MPKKFVDLDGLKAYHDNVVNALDRKSNKTHLGYDAPTESYIDVWLCLNDSEDISEQETIEPVSLFEEELTFNEEEEELTFNEGSPDEELTFEEPEEELTFNEEEEELIFNPESE